jgi:hypothetical protein
MQNFLHRDNVWSRCMPMPTPTVDRPSILLGPRKIGQEERSESGQNFGFFDQHLGAIRTGFVEFFETANAGIRTSLKKFGYVRCISGQIFQHVNENFLCKPPVLSNHLSYLIYFLTWHPDFGVTQLRLLRKGDFGFISTEKGVVVGRGEFLHDISFINYFTHHDGLYL